MGSDPSPAATKKATNFIPQNHRAGLFLSAYVITQRQKAGTEPCTVKCREREREEWSPRSLGWGEKSEAGMNEREKNLTKS